MRQTTRPVRVAIVTTQEVVARGLVAMLSDYPERVVVTTLPGTRSRATGVDVILYDTLGLYNAEGADLDHLLHRTSATVIAFSRDMRPDLRAHALALGCHAWVSMSIHAVDLVHALESAASGRPLPEQVDRFGALADLTAREVDIAALIALGMSNEEICERLHLSLNTLKSHIRHLYRKIGVTRRAHAVGWALQHGFAGPGG